MRPRDLRALLGNARSSEHQTPGARIRVRDSFQRRAFFPRLAVLSARRPILRNIPHTDLIFLIKSTKSARAFSSSDLSTKD